MLHRLLGVIALSSFFIAACTTEEPVIPVPVELTRDHACSVCGMIIVDFPGAKSQIHYQNGKVDYFCSTQDMFVFYNQTDRPAHITQVFVHDMGKADRDLPHNHWIDAQKAYYVYGGDVMGAMGDALVPFSDSRDAGQYVEKHGGRVVLFADVTMKMLRPDAHH